MPRMRRYCLTLDLIDDPKLIAEYRKHHQNVWPEIRDSILSSGIESMEIYLLGTRLCMVVDATDAFSFSMKSVADAADPRVQEWETLMWKYQQPLPLARPGEKWVLMEEIFALRKDAQ